MDFADGREGTKHREMQGHRAPTMERLRLGLVLGDGGRVKGVSPFSRDGQTELRQACRNTAKLGV